MFKDFFTYELFSLGSYSLLVKQLVFFAIAVLVLSLVYRVILKKWLPGLFNRYPLSAREQKRISKFFLVLFIACLVLAAFVLLKLDYPIIRTADYRINLSLLVDAFIVIQLARMFDWFITNIFIHSYYTRRDQLYKDEDSKPLTDTESNAAKIVQYIVYALAAIIILKSFNLDPQLYTTDYDDKVMNFHLTNFIIAILILLFARLFIWLLTQLILYGIYRKKDIDLGSQYAINQLLKYVIYVIAVVIALQKLGIDMTLILGGGAALLVGIGLGLQQTFNDFFSGIVLLFEQSVSVGDILEFDQYVGTVKRIGLRSSIIETRENVSLVVPNSRLVSNYVVNWTQFDNKVRFEIPFNVSYDSDAELVKTILLEVTKENEYTLNFPPPFARLKNFGDNSLDFSIYFFSRSYLMIEDVKSDIRIDVAKRFKEENISIPFPQRDIYVKNIRDLKT